MDNIDFEHFFHTSADYENYQSALFSSEGKKKPNIDLENYQIVFLYAAKRQ